MLQSDRNFLILSIEIRDREIRKRIQIKRKIKFYSRAFRMYYIYVFIKICYGTID